MKPTPGIYWLTLRAFCACLLVCVLSAGGRAQVANVEFGKNRVQHHDFKWQVLSSDRFDFYFYDSLGSFAKHVASMAYEELQNMEEKLGYSLPNKFNILFYLSYEDYVQSNVGIGLDWYGKNHIARLVQNKVLLYYSSSTILVRKQIREGLIRLIVEYILMGREKGEQPASDKIGKFPDWLIKGYISYQADGWTTDMDYQLRIRADEDTYKSFPSFIGREPFFAGVTFWYYIERKYGKLKANELFRAMHFSANLNVVCSKVLDKKYRHVHADIFPYFKELFKEDERKRKDAPKGKSFTRVPLHKPNQFRRYYDVVSIIANPATKRGIYARIDFKEGRSKVIVWETRSRKRTILSTGVYLYDNTITENYPQIAWTPNGNRLGVLSFEAGKLAFFEYDILRRTKVTRVNFSDYFTAVHDFQYLDNQGKILISAVRRGQGDIYIFNVRTLEMEQITNDVYDNIDPAMVTFGKKIGILFSSNRPIEQAEQEADPTDLSFNDNESERGNMNIFIADYSAPFVPHEISPLTFLKYGDARYPSQYNNRSFSYVSDENGIQNRYVSDVVSTKKGLDTFYYFAGESYKNISRDSLHLLLKVQKKLRADSIRYVARTEEVVHDFPITNYKNGIIESKYVGGVHPLLTDLKYTSMSKQLYKVDVVDQKQEAKLHLPTLQPTAFRMYKGGIVASANPKKKRNLPSPTQEFNPTNKDTIAYYKNYFLSAFQFNPLFNSPLFDAPINLPTEQRTQQVLARRLSVRLRPFLHTRDKYYRKFFLDMFDVTLDNNNLLPEQSYQPYQGGSGPIFLNGAGQLLGMVKFNTLENIENWKLLVGYRIPLSFTNHTTDFIADVKYLKYRVDLGATYFRNARMTGDNTRTISNYFLGHVAYPLDVVQSLRLTFGARRDYESYKITPQNFNIIDLPDSVSWTSLFRLEYVYDNTINPVKNIWKGLRFKVFSEMFFNMGRYNTVEKNPVNVFNFDQTTFNVGFDIRYYKPIYKNIIWATRFSMAFSYGQRRMIYYLGGVDGWFLPKFNNANTPDATQNYGFQTLAVNMRGFQQNVANGNKNFVFNTELRVPVLTSFIRRPISSNILRNLMALLFIDAGAAWTGIVPTPPKSIFANSNTQVILQPTNLPFAMGYGWGFRTGISSYYIRIDRGYPVGERFFKSGIWYFAIGLDF